MVHLSQRQCRAQIVRSDDGEDPARKDEIEHARLASSKTTVGDGHNPPPSSASGTICLTQ